MVIFLFLSSRVLSWRFSPGTSGIVHAVHFPSYPVLQASFHKSNRLQGARWILHGHVLRVCLIGSRPKSCPCTHTSDRSRTASPAECSSCRRMILLLITRPFRRPLQDASAYGALHDG